MYANQILTAFPSKKTQSKIDKILKMESPLDLDEAEPIIKINKAILKG